MSGLLKRSEHYAKAGCHGQGSVTTLSVQYEITNEDTDKLTLVHATLPALMVRNYLLRYV